MFPRTMIISLTTISFHHLLLLLLIVTSLFDQLLLSEANDTIDTTQSLTGNQTLVSSGGRFELGFFSPGNSENWYIGIWYKQVAVVTPVWVANRENPVQDITSAALKVIKPGLIAVINRTNDIVWSSNTTSKAVRNPVAQLLNNGNLVLRDADDDDRPENYLWQSFDYPTDSRIPEMKMGWDFVSGVELYATSWKSIDDPALGEYRTHIDPQGRLQFFIMKGSTPMYRVGPWNGVSYSGMINFKKDPSIKFSMNITKTSVYTVEGLTSQSLITRFTLNPSGSAMRYVWVHETQSWSFSMSIPTDVCDNYKICGAHGICRIGNAPVCSCLDKFVPQDQQGWDRLDWSKGCVRRTELNCEAGNGFVKYPNIKLPDSRKSWYKESMTLKECKEECLQNCSCTAYTNLDIEGDGCLLWFGDLVDIRALPADGQDIYIRMASSELELKVRRKNKAAVISSAAGSSFLVLLMLVCWLRRKKSASKDRNIGRINDEARSKDLELPAFDLRTILKATSNFSVQNKLGEGGYGPVYKGKMEDGEDIAVKRLSMTSLQGFDELRNEVSCIAKLQHRNLVKLLGYCIQEEEKMLIYEYMPNKSLDLIIFDENRRKLLDWQKRLHIIRGIARGLLYLHQDSRLRIIHRDLKASNILLDADLNPKISDFGLARIFKGSEESSHKTNRVVGTYGYMPPEYAVHGRFSTKSDVFSFGVLLLEIVSGKRNSLFDCENSHINLLGHAWTLFKEGKSMESVDGSLSITSLSTCVVLRLIQVGLLCVQQHADDRPSMSSVVAMIDNEIALPEPTQPAFHADRSLVQDTINNQISSTNQISITILEPR